MSQAGVYNELKMPWLFARKPELPDVPRQVHWILSDLCNEDCSFCTYRVSGNPSNELFSSGAKLSAYGHDNPVRWVNTDRALRLVDEMRSLGVRAIQATGGGEPSVHPDHELIFEKILDSEIQLALVSNGFRWRDRIFPLVPRMTWLRVSVDAGCPQTYSSIRRVSETAFFKVLGNIERAAKEIDSAKTQTVLGVGYTVTPDNWMEIVIGAKIAKESGAHNLRISAMFGPEDEKPFLPIYDQIRCLISEAKALYQDDKFVIYDNFGSRLDDLKQHSPDYNFCPYQFFTTYLGGDLNLYRCCVLSYSRKGMIAGGDLTNQRLDDFWRSEQRKVDLNSLDPRSCPKCMFNGKNRAMLYVMGNTESDTAPRHMDFP